MRLSRGDSFRGCRHFFMFKPLSLLVSQIAPTAASFSTGQPRPFYVRAYRALLPPHAPHMLSVRYRQLTEKGLSPFKIYSLVGCYGALPYSAKGTLLAIGGRNGRRGRSGD